MLIDAFEASLSLPPLSALAKTALAAVVSLTRGTAAAIFALEDGEMRVLASSLSESALARLQEGRADAPPDLDGATLKLPIRHGDTVVGMLCVEGARLQTPEMKGRIQPCLRSLGRMLSHGEFLPEAKDGLTRRRPRAEVAPEAALCPAPNREHRPGSPRAS